MREVQVTRIFERNLCSSKPIVVNVGGARSSKSYSILQLLVQKFVSEPKKTILIARKTVPSLRLTAYRVFVDMLKEYGYYPDCVHNRTNKTIEYQMNPDDPTCKSVVYFLSIDDPEKIKSTEFNYAFLEEANEFSYNDFFITWTRMSGQTIDEEPNRLFLALNPNDEFSWINQKLHEWEDVEWVHSTYKDNPFLSAEYRKILEDLEHQDPTLYLIYALGQWAQLPNVIYRNYVEEWEGDVFDEIWYGVDFGFNHPTALIQIGRRGGELWIKELIHESGMTNNDLIDEMGKLGVDTRSPMYADNAEPARIEEIDRAGYNVFPAEKSVNDGIDRVKRYRLHVHPESVNLLKEFKTYKWMEDKNGRVLDKPVKFNDDGMDGMRYGIYTHLIDEGDDGVFVPRGH